MNRSRMPGHPAARELALLCFGAAAMFSVFTMGGPLVPLMLVDLKASPSLLGLVMSVSAIGSLAVGIPGGLLIGKFGARAPIIAAAWLIAASAAFLGAFPTITGLFIGLSVMEIGKIIVIIGAQAQVSSLGPGRDSIRDFGWFSTFSALGQMVGPAAAGLCIDAWGLVPTWFVMAGLTAATVCVFPLFLSSGKSASAGPGAGAGKSERIGRMLNMMTLIAILASFVVVFGMGTRGSFYPVLLKEHFGFSATIIGSLLSLAALATLSVRFFMSALVRFFGGHVPALIAAVSVLGIGLGTTPLCFSIELLALNSILVGMGMGLALPLSMALVTNGVKEEDRGLAIGVRMSGNRVAQMLNPAFFGFTAQAFGLPVAFYAGGVLMLLAAAPILAWQLGRSTRAGS